MNIIVPTLKNDPNGYDFVSYDNSVVYDISSVNFYLAAEPEFLNIQYEDLNGFIIDKTLVLEATDLTMKGSNGQTYTLYEIIMTTEDILSAREYSCELKLTDTETPYNFNLRLSRNFYEDEHLPFTIVNRELTLPKGSVVTLVEEDSRSECLSFKINKQYDGISFLDSSKKIFADYVPVVLTEDEQKQGISFFSDEITQKIEKTENGTEFVLLEWAVPRRLVQDSSQEHKNVKAKIALSVVEAENDTYPYVWQTLPFEIEVKKNIGNRSSFATTPENVITISTLYNLLVSDFQPRLEALESGDYFEFVNAGTKEDVVE